MHHFQIVFHDGKSISNILTVASKFSPISFVATKFIYAKGWMPSSFVNTTKKRYGLLNSIVIVKLT